MRIPYDNIETRVMIGLVKGVRNHGRLRICWIVNIIAWKLLSCVSHKPEGVSLH